jgi:hypothetical protein
MVMVRDMVRVRVRDVPADVVVHRQVAEHIPTTVNKVEATDWVALVRTRRPEDPCVTS